jgi:hypothetical protein
MPELSIMLWVILIVLGCIFVLVCLIASIAVWIKLSPTSSFSLREIISLLRPSTPVAEVVAVDSSPRSPELGILFTGIPYGRNRLARVVPIEDPESPPAAGTNNDDLMPGEQAVQSAHTVRGLAVPSGP